MKSPLITIITVTYNSEETLEATINSVIDQTYSNKELIIIDGKSTDSTVDIINKYESSITYWISEPDNGIPDALNKGIKAAKGGWLYFLSSDDVFYDVSTLSRVFDKYYDADMIYGNVILKSKNIIFNGEYDKKKLMSYNICHQAQFFHKNLFKKLGIYNNNYQLLSDYDLTLRAFSNPNISIKYIDETIAVFNDTGRTSYIIDDKFYKDRRKLFIRRFSDSLNKRDIVKSFEPYYVFCIKKGKLLKGLIVACELLYYTKNTKYIFDTLKLIKDRTTAK